jgi:hypothetical protein
MRGARAVVAAVVPVTSASGVTRLLFLEAAP